MAVIPAASAPGLEPLHFDLRRVDSASYSSAAEEYLAALRADRCVVAVYQFGTVRHAGVSDIDFLVVLANDAVAYRIGALTQYQRVSLGDYLFTHPPVVIPERLASRLHLVHTAANLRKLYGAEYEFAPLDWHQTLAHYIDSYPGVLSNLCAVSDAAVGMRAALQILANGVFSLRLLATLLQREEFNRDVDAIDATRGELARRATEHRTRDLGVDIRTAAGELRTLLIGWDVVLEGELDRRGFIGYAGSEGVASPPLRRHHLAQFAFYADRFQLADRWPHLRAPHAPRALDAGWREHLGEKSEAVADLRAFLKHCPFGAVGIEFRNLHPSRRSLPQRVWSRLHRTWPT